MRVTDIVVVGAGPAGAAVAKHLADAGRKVLLVDGGPAPELKIGESLPGAARALLRDLGLLHAVMEGGHLPYYGNVSAWGSDTPVALDSIRDPSGPGWHLNRAVFDTAVRAAAVAAGAVRVAARLGSLVEAGSGAAAGWHVTLDDGTRIAARFVIDASGRPAACARHLGIGRQADTPLLALYAWGPDASTDRRTLIEAVPEGWWYTAPQPEGRRVAALHVRPDAAAGAKSPTQWIAALEQTRHVRLCCDLAGDWTPPRGTLAGGACLDQAAGERWLAVGDAALAYDPLAAQGLFNALYTALRGGQAVNAALNGDDGLIQTYAERLKQVRATYCERLLHHYRSEQRWADQPFWWERHQSLVA